LQWSCEARNEWKNRQIAQTDLPLMAGNSWTTVGPNRDCTRPLRSVLTQAVEKYANQINYNTSGWSGHRRSMKMTLK